MPPNPSLLNQRTTDRIYRVRDYIHTHLDEPLDLDRLADIACLSRFHWHRVYRGLMHETAVQTVRRLRLQRAAFDLASTTLDLDAIAARAAYATPTAFSKAFAASYGQPPATFRKAGQHSAILLAVQQEDAMAFPVELRALPARPALGLVHEGPYMEIGRSFDRLMRAVSAAGLMPNVRGSFGRYIDDPDLVPAEKLRSHACVFLDTPGLMVAGLEPFDAGGGDYAVLRFKGPYAGLGAAYDWLCGTWLEQSCREMTDGPILEVYLNTPMDTAPQELLTEICLPLK
jgi:AraC family transcriptional regulator